MTITGATGNYRRLAGVLRMAGRSPMLEAGDGHLLRLITPDDLASYAGASVIVEGNMAGPDRLQVEWIGRPAQ